MLLFSALVPCVQLIAAYSAPAAVAPPPEADSAYDAALSSRLDFKDSDMKRLSMEIERERSSARAGPSSRFFVFCL